MLNTLPHNNRALKIFRFIQQHANFDWSTVVDFGCGYGDMSIYAAMFGAQRVIAIDKDPEAIRITAAKAESMGFGDTIVLHQANIMDMTNETLGHHDYGFCMSVLPYLDAHDQIFFLVDATKQVKTLFLECQYNGDGPGLEFIHGDDDMIDWLDSMGIKATKIGETIVKQGRYHRSIWKCNDGQYDYDSGLPEIGEYMAIETPGRLSKFAGTWDYRSVSPRIGGTG